MSYEPQQFKTDFPEPNGWIQFKGTDICVDLHCECGELSHIDGDFVYYYECPKCKAVWELDGHIKLYRVPTEHEEEIRKTEVIKRPPLDETP